MSDGRVFQTVTGELVRSKSEMLLANEFTRLGILYEYEQPAENVSNALPDFILSDYGNVIVEHLGLMNDAEYLRRWHEKAKKYEAEGILYLCTNEEGILNLSQTVERIREHASYWCEKMYGVERLLKIKKEEENRRINQIAND